MKQPTIRFYNEHPTPATMLNEVLQGLAARPRRIAPKFFYDERGYTENSYKYSLQEFHAITRTAGLRPRQT